MATLSGRTQSTPVRCLRGTMTCAICLKALGGGRGWSAGRILKKGVRVPGQHQYTGTAGVTTSARLARAEDVETFGIEAGAAVLHDQNPSCDVGLYPANMADGTREPEATSRSLTVDFAGWLDYSGTPDREFYESALIVLDANVLLYLYEIGAVARTEVFAALAGVGVRLWVPHQAALEFSRNRKRVVKDRISRFTSVRRSLRAAARDAAGLLEDTVEQVTELRIKNRTSRPWDLAEARLDRSSLEARLDGVMDSALTELEDLEAEHDLHPQDMQGNDRLFDEIDHLLTGVIGAAPSREQLRALVEEAVSFRFPNRIPPGYSDAGKETPLAAAGDYLLWREVLDKARDVQSSTLHVLLVTGDMKPDWWLLDEKNVPIRARPELVQEMRSEAGAELLIVSLATFINGVREYLSVHISDDTVGQLREVALESDFVYDDQRPHAVAPVNLLTLPHSEFEHLVRSLLFSMGYTTLAFSTSADTAFDIIVRDSKALVPSKVVVQVKRYRHSVGVQIVREIFGAMVHLHADAAVIVATSNFNSSALVFAEDKPIRLIDGSELLRLLAEHLDINAIV